VGRSNVAQLGVTSYRDPASVSVIGFRVELETMKHKRLRVGPTQNVIRLRDANSDCRLDGRKARSSRDWPTVPRIGSASDSFAVKQNKHRVVAHSRLSAARLNTATSLRVISRALYLEKADQSTEG